MDALISLAVRHVENALTAADPLTAGYSWKMAEVWLRKASFEMRNGA